MRGIVFFCRQAAGTNFWNLYDYDLPFAHNHNLSHIFVKKSHLSYLSMERNLQIQLIAWKNKPNRLPLILRGARQVGKTYLMKWLGQTHFQDVAYFNFDERPELRQFFQMHKDVDRITQSLVV